MEYTDTGNGFPVVLIHGFCEDKRIWEATSKELSKHFRVLCPDLPGFGESRLEEPQVSMEYFADKLQELLHRLSISSCVMIGHSLGGYVALAYAQRYEANLMGLGLFHSTAFADSEEKKENRTKTIEFIERHGVKCFSESFVAPLFSLRNREVFKSDIQQLIQMASSSSEHGVVETTKAMRDRKDQTRLLQQLSIPVLFVAGKLDGAVPLEKTLEQCHLPKQSIVHILEGVGHMGMVEAPKQTMRILRLFTEYCL